MRTNARHRRAAAFPTEQGGWRKRWTGRLPVALIFPNAYRVGMASLGFQAVYGLLNRDEAIVCERFFLPSPGLPLLSIESGRPLADFPLVFCSISFEEDYLHLAEMLRAGGIVLSARDRLRCPPLKDRGKPLVVAGGAAICINPEPLAPFLDLCVVGEAEPVLPALMTTLREELPATGREELLRGIAGTIPGCYVPGLYTVEHEADGRIAALRPCPGAPAQVQSARLLATPRATRSEIITPDAEFSDIFLTELGRGCSRSCRFCAAAFISRPPRRWAPAAILGALAERPEGLRRVGLLGFEMLEGETRREVFGYLRGHGCELSFSSLRADAVDESLIELFGQARPKTLTIAPDGGSERLRRVINKNMSETDILSAAERLAETGIARLKVYAMVGLPTESDEDIAELAGLVQRIRERLLAVGRRRGRLCDLVVSLNNFVPKAWTPFQWHPFAAAADLKARHRLLRDRIARLPNVTLKAESPEGSGLQAVLARGDRRVAALLPALAGNRAWRKVFREAGLDPAWYAERQRGEDEIFPWEILDHGVTRRYLWKEYRKALAGKLTPACDPERCRACGVCHD